RHSVRNQWDLLEAIPGWNGGGADETRDSVEMALDPGADARMAQRLTQAGVAPGDELIVMHVSAGNPFRRWPESFFAETAATLAARSPPGRPPAIPTFSIETAVADLPCRPCDQRICAHGDFRCLTQLGPARVIAAAEQALTAVLPPEGGSHGSDR